MVRSARSRRRVVVLPLVVSAMAVLGTGSAQAAMLVGDGFDVVAVDPDALFPATVIEAATTDEDPPFLCRMIPPDEGDD